MPLVFEFDADDSVSHPAHYTDRGIKCPGCGRDIECIDIARHFPYTLGAAIKYIWRAGRKNDATEDLRKAQQYLQFEIDG